MGEDWDHIVDVLQPVCYDCGRPYGNQYGFPDLIIPNDKWKAISPDGEGNGLLCPSCMCARAHVAKMISIPAVFQSGPFCCEGNGDRADY